ncbi:UNVERIFIED_CONTAM: hypothetical protein GTU68_066765 [Idotea baltica]|nr:hypothetical protein [Idotea baltica]
MKYSKLGNTDLDVSKICLGTMTFGEQNNETEAHDQLNYALDNGVNFIDTAELYAVPSTEENSGLTEKYIGTWLKNRTDRDKIIVATKVAGPSAGLKYISENLGFSKTRILEAVEGSLKRLQTNYIDLYQLHWPERRSNMFGTMNYAHWEEWEDNFKEILETMQGLVNEGKIRYFGISNETPWGLNNFLKVAAQHNLPRCMSVQNPYSLLNRLYEVGLAEVSIREKAGLLAYSPMAFGLLSGKYHKKTDSKNSRLNKFKNMARYNSQNCFDATAKYLEIAEKHGLTLAEMSLAFINQQLFVTSNIIGATNLEQLKENIGSINVELSAEILKEIEGVHSQYSNPAP